MRYLTGLLLGTGVFCALSGRSLTVAPITSPVDKELRWPAGSLADSGDPQPEEPKASVWIIVEPQQAGPAPLRVTFKAKVAGLTPPLAFHWDLGNGRECEEPEPPRQVYGVGRFNVILTVTDGKGHVKKASVTIDSQCRGC